MAQDQWTLRKEKLARSQAARMQSLAHETQVWGTWPAAHTQSKASPFLHGCSEQRRMSCANAVSWRGCLQGSPNLNVPVRKAMGFI